MFLTIPFTAYAHGGGLDGQGCHHNHKEGGYHCHRGPLAGQSFSSKNDALKTPQQPEAALEGKPSIIDGDTIWIGKTKVRLHGIDAPEMKQTCKTPKGNQSKCGVLSKQFLSDLLSNREITCKGEEKDRYGRLIAVCFIDWMDINEQIVMED